MVNEKLMIQSYYRLVYRILSVRNLRFLKFASSSVSHKLRFASICFCPQATLYFAYRLRHPHIVAVLRFVAYSGSFHFTLRKFRLLKILKLQLSLASYRSRSLRFRITLFHKSEFSPLENS